MRSGVSGSPGGRRSGSGDPFLAGINDEPPAAQKADQRQSQFARQLHRKTRRRGHGRQERNASAYRFLHDLEPATTADHKRVTAERQTATEQRPTDDLVHGIVSADVFAQGEQVAVAGEKRRCMQPTGSAKNGLRLPQSQWQLAKCLRIE